MQISLVAAASENDAIGVAGGLPWRLPDDQRFFKQLTLGHCVLMGRRTFESLPRPLPGRTNIVLSRDVDYDPDGVLMARDLEAALESARAQRETEAFVVGGAAVYEKALPLAARIYLTRVHAQVDGDVHFPDFRNPRYGAWRLIEEDFHPADSRHAHAFSFQRWERSEGAAADAIKRS